MSDPRVVSTSPSGTEILCALGVEPVAVSHACDYPPRVRELPVIDRSRVSATASADRHEQTRRAAREGGVYDVDTDLLREVAPDLVLTQTVCGVCAVDEALVREVLADQPVDPEVVGLRASTLGEVFDCIERVGALVEREERAAALVTDLRERVDDVRERTPEDRPRVAVLEWLDPVHAAANWVPELVDAAGGRYGLAEAGARSVEPPWAEVRAYDPEVLVLAPCGFDLDATHQRLEELAGRDGWTDLSAVREGRVYALDGSAYLNRWTPRLVDALDRLAAVVHPDVFGPHPADVVAVVD